MSEFLAKRDLFEIYSAAEFEKNVPFVPVREFLSVTLNDGCFNLQQVASKPQISSSVSGSPRSNRITGLAFRRFIYIYMDKKMDLVGPSSKMPGCFYIIYTI